MNIQVMPIPAFLMLYFKAVGLAIVITAAALGLIAMNKGPAHPKRELRGN